MQIAYLINANCKFILLANCKLALLANCKSDPNCRHSLWGDHQCCWQDVPIGRRSTESWLSTCGTTSFVCAVCNKQYADREMRAQSSDYEWHIKPLSLARGRKVTVHLARNPLRCSERRRQYCDGFTGTLFLELRKISLAEWGVRD